MEHKDDAAAILFRAEQHWCIEGDYAPDDENDKRHPLERRLASMQAMHMVDVEKLRAELAAERSQLAQYASALEECGKLLGTPLRQAADPRHRFDARSFYEQMTDAYSEARDSRERLIAGTRRIADKCAALSVDSTYPRLVRAALETIADELRALLTPEQPGVERSTCSDT